jgi:predicted amidophosphoribosyltransferase
MKFIGEHTASGKQLNADNLRCPRCAGPLKHTNDMQRSTRFSYWRCLKEHGRFIRFFEFLREKNFVRPLSPQQIAELRQNLQTVNCSNCGAPVNLESGAVCSHCGSPISMLDMRQPELLLNELKQTAAKPIDPSWLLELTRERRDQEWWSDASTSGVVQAGLGAVARWLTKTGIG